MPEKRMESRSLCADILEVEWMQPDGWVRVATGLLEDISAAGACLQMEFEIREGSPVEIRYQGKVIQATVKYCVYRDIGFFVGVDFCGDFRWSPTLFHTRHLLDLTTLGR